MNERTRVMWNLAQMHGYASDALLICRKYDNDYEKVLEDMIARHAVNMCLVQLGEHAARIRDLDMNLYRDHQLNLFQIKGMRDRITHSYGEIDYKIVKEVLQKDLPVLKKTIEEIVDADVIKDPYILHEEEYDDVVRGWHTFR